MNWLEKLFYREPQDIIIHDKFRNENINIGKATLLKSWNKDDFNHYYYTAYLLESGKIIVFIETWFVEQENSYRKEFENADKFWDYYFPKPSKVEIR
jgi:hypothetical protein